MLLKFLTHYWFSLLAIPMFAAGAVIDPGVAEGASDVVTDGGEGSSDLPTEGEPTESGSGEGADDLPAVETPGEEEPAAEPTQDSRVLTGPIRKVLADLKASNPEAYKQLKSEIFGGRQAKEALENLRELAGVEKVEEIAERLSELGGFEAVQELNNEVQEYRALDEAWINGDFQTFATAIAQYPDGFKKMMPAMAGEWARIDGDGFNRYGAGIVDATLKNGQVGTSLYLLKHILSRSTDTATKQEANGIISGIEQFLSKVSEIATKPVVQPTGTEKNPELEQREKRVAEQESKQFFSTVGSQAATYQRTEISKEIKALAGTKQISTDGVQVIQRQVMQAIMDRLNADQSFVTKYDRYCEARDAAGAQKFLNTSAAKLIPEITKKVFRGIYGQPKAATKPGTPAGKPNGQPAAKGWIKVSGPPDGSKIDRSKTTRSMVYDSQAILSDGKRVYWGDRAPQV